MTTARDIVEKFSSIESDVHFAIAIWTTKDVLGIAHEMGYKIPYIVAESILGDIEWKQDNDNGITWTTLRCAIEDYPDILKYETEVHANLRIAWEQIRAQEINAYKKSDKPTPNSLNDIRDVIKYILEDQNEYVLYADHILDEHATEEERKQFEDQLLDREDLIEKYRHEPCEAIYCVALRLDEQLDTTIPILTESRKEE